MATEAVYPTSLDSETPTNMVGGFADVDESPITSDDGNWHARSTTQTTTFTDVTYGTGGSTLTPSGTNNQTLRVRLQSANRDGNVPSSSDPEYTVYVDGTSVGTGTVTSGNQLDTHTFDASVFTDISSGCTVRIEQTAHGGGSPASRGFIGIGGVEVTVDGSTGVDVSVTAASATATGGTVTVDTTGPIFGGGAGEPSLWEISTDDFYAAEQDIEGPGTVAVDDLLLCMIWIDEDQTSTTGSTTGSMTGPTGWTELDIGSARTAGGTMACYMWYKIAVSADTTGTPQKYIWSCPGSGDSDAGVGIIMRIQDYWDTTPVADVFDIIEFDSPSGTTETQLDFAGGTTGYNKEMLLCFGGVEEAATGLDPWWSNPPVSGWTQLMNRQAGAADIYVGGAGLIQDTAGSTGTVTITEGGSNSGPMCGWLVSIVPSSPVAGGGGPIDPPFIISVST